MRRIADVGWAQTIAFHVLSRGKDISFSKLQRNLTTFSAKIGPATIRIYKDFNELLLLSYRGNIFRRRQSLVFFEITSDVLWVFKSQFVGYLRH